MTTIDPRTTPSTASRLTPTDLFARRHIGPDLRDREEMLRMLGLSTLEELIERAVPREIRSDRTLAIASPIGEHAVGKELAGFAQRNRVLRSCIGMGYHGTVTPPVILRNVMENPCWYTQYTPYQAEIAQGRLEALLNFQTMVADLTGLPVANASLLDEATAAAEAMIMCRGIAGEGRGVFLVADDCHPQTIEVVKGRAETVGIRIKVISPERMDFTEASGGDDVFGVLVQNPSTDGVIRDLDDLAGRLHEAGALLVVAADLLSLAMVRSPGEMSADIAIGSTQRFGVPMGYGGPHAAYIATHEKHVRRLPGRLVGVSRDAEGHRALRLAIQTREQHIKRDRATSNICTAQVLLAIMAGFYAVYHGPEGIRRIAGRVHALTCILAQGLRRLGYDCGDRPFFDTLRIVTGAATSERVLAAALARGINLRRYESGGIGVSLDETVGEGDVAALLEAFAEGHAPPGAEESHQVPDIAELMEAVDCELPDRLIRRTGYLTHEIFSSCHSETEMLRYITRLQSRDLSLAHSMIPLGSCTMKLNATTEMLPVTWPGFADVHPFAPADQAEGYHELFSRLEVMLAEITGFAAVSLQPNAGSQGEYAGLLVIRALHRSRGEPHRDVCLIPTSAHGTNPASAVAAGFRVVPIRCDEDGNIDIGDLKAKAQTHAAQLGALMITYPSTHGVFETTIREVCEIVHASGGQVYLDGANMNALVGICRPGEFGADVCHLNLHKTFCIPHGGGGPGMGPICVAAHLAPFLPGHGVKRPDSAGAEAIPAVSAAPYGSAAILTIPYAYLRMMGGTGLREATAMAILNANYMAHRLRPHYDILYTGPGGFVAHEFIVDLRAVERSAGIRIEDVAKRLMDYGFHAPTMAWPVAGTLMIEPTESETRAELDRFCDAMIAIRAEITAIEEGRVDRERNPLKLSPHPIECIASDAWDRPYTREQAAFPLPWLRERKFWPPVARVDNPYGDRNLTCTCPPMETYASSVS